MPDDILTAFVDLAMEGCERLGVDPPEWMRLRAAELGLAHYLVVVPSRDATANRDVAMTCPPRELAAATHSYGVDRAAAYLFAHQDAESLEHASETVKWLLAVWDRDERVVLPVPTA